MSDRCSLCIVSVFLLWPSRCQHGKCSNLGALLSCASCSLGPQHQLLVILAMTGIIWTLWILSLEVSQYRSHQLASPWRNLNKLYLQQPRLLGGASVDLYAWLTHICSTIQFLPHSCIILERTNSTTLYPNRFLSIYMKYKFIKVRFQNLKKCAHLKLWQLLSHILLVYHHVL